MSSNPFGTLVAVGILYLWLTALPLREGARWAWHAIMTSGVAGFGCAIGVHFAEGYTDVVHLAPAIAGAALFAAGVTLEAAGAGRARHDLVVKL